MSTSDVAQGASTNPAVRVFVVVNAANEDARRVARSTISALRSAGVQVSGTARDIQALEQDGLADAFSRDELEVLADDTAVGRARGDVVACFGGDGTILRAAELAEPGTPLLGVNLGHVGFLAEAEPEDVQFVVEALIARRWSVEERTRLRVNVVRDGEIVDSTWALNEVSMEKGTRERMIEVLVEVDGRPLSRWGCDGVVCATPTGSTAYAFSAGGPVVWPEVAALLVVPLSAHALFARPLVVSPSSTIALDLAPGSHAVLWADGRRTIDLLPGDRLVVTADPIPVRFARLAPAPFTDRLVAKFDLPVDGWRGRQR